MITSVEWLLPLTHYFNKVQTRKASLILSLLLLAVGLVGQAGLIVALYNRVNATGISRVTIKRLEKGILLVGSIIPLSLLGLEFARAGSGWPPLAFWEWHWSTQTYLYTMWFYAFLSAPGWLLARPCFSLAKERGEVVDSVLWNRPREDRSLIAGKKFSRMGKLPRNQIAWTEANRKQIYLDQLPSDLEGLKIAHLSDIHFTGQMGISYYRRAMDWVMEGNPDMIVIAGDIVDYAHALDNIEAVFGSLSAPLGMYFVLGNHDRRLANPMEVCDRLVAIGWKDLGATSSSTTRGGVRIDLLGNERPWFNRADSIANYEIPSESEAVRWRLGVSHSPDQFAWGVEHGCALMLCGHTHGGQIRFPGIGPLVAPSWYGSRYASGIFEKSGTVMHVSRGLSGVHPYRWGCPPEVSILELAARASLRSEA